MSKPREAITTQPKPPNTLAASPELEKRLERFTELLDWIRPVPEQWIRTISSSGVELITLKPIECNSYKDVISSWKKALRWRQDLDDVFSVMLAVAISTIQQGDQLFVMLIGDAGSGKTRLCDAMLVSHHCFALEHLTGFFSGCKGEGDEDFSLISRVNGKLMITPEGDVLMSNPKFTEIMSQQRRIFDGVSGATYKNRKDDLRYSGLRTPWIIAGTPALLDSDQTRLGDRFLKVFLNSPSDEERKKILNKISRSAFEAVQLSSNGENHVGAALQEAYCKTAGYIDWLRANTHLLGEITCEPEYLDLCECQGDFTSYLRARAAKKDGLPTREQPTRLTSQYVRLMSCLTVVLNRTEVDQEVLRRLRRVVLNTSSGIGYDVAETLYSLENQYTPNRAFHIRLDYERAQVDKQLKLMKQIGALKLSTEDSSYVQKTSKPYWKLSPRLYALFDLIVKSGAQYNG